ncbi:MAG: hypothetical protein WCL71_18420 [Deltaproteobacteria bacterium]
MYYHNITKTTHKALFYLKHSSRQPFRDVLDNMQLAFLTTAGYLIQQAIEDGMMGALSLSGCLHTGTAASRTLRGATSTATAIDGR